MTHAVGLGNLEDLPESNLKNLSIPKWAEGDGRSFLT